VRTLHHRDGHHGWDRARPPRCTAAPGDELELVLADCFGGQLPADAGPRDVAALDLALANPLTGPVAVAGAEPGDAVGVELLDVAVGTTGWTTLIPGFGLLADRFPEPHVVRSTIDGEDVDFGGLARLRRRPFLGTLGLAPGEPGEHSVIPPRRVGGNLDCRDVRPGATVWLPVEVPGALLSAGDPHAAQGDGEVCGTAVETTATARIRLHLRPGAAPPAPWIEVAGAATPAPSSVGPRVVTTGVGPSLEAGARDATLAMIEHLVATAGLAPEDAYALCSVAADLRIVEVVDAPNWVVAMDLDLGVLI
jgi:acetamidase/formamidase